MKKYFAFVLTILLAASVTGCGKKADSKKPIEQVRAEAEKMSVGDLEATARAYANEIAAKKGEVEKIQSQLKGLSIKDMLGEKARGIKDQASAVGQEISALTERYEVYAQKFQAAGGDISKVKIA